ncbi:unnamed protein product, partial [Meganyctiphanes norvegica]
MNLERKRFQWFVLTFLTLTILVYFTLDSKTYMVKDIQHNFEKSQERHLQTVGAKKPLKEMQILMWTNYHNNKENDYNHIFQRLNSNQCSENRCKLSYNRTEYKKADAVLFSLAYLNNRANYEIPETHPVDQLWVLLSFEAGISSKKKNHLSSLSSIGFNWTMHFRQDSDIVVPYGYI